MDVLTIVAYVLGAPVIITSLVMMGSVINRFLNGTSLSSIFSKKSDKEVANS